MRGAAAWRLAAAVIAGAFGVAMVDDALAAGAVHALVVGIDDYRHVGGLRGAVNDAKDLSAALRSQGVSDVTVLLDGQATRDAMVRAWQGMLTRTKPGDRVILTFSGHGSTELVPQNERRKDSNNTVILLGGFNATGPGLKERIYSKEIHAWLKDAEARGAEVVVVMDSCHSGGMARSIDGRAEVGLARSVPAYTLPDEMDVRIDLPDDGLAPTPGATISDLHDLPKTTFLAGAQITEKVYEVNVPGPDGKPARRGPLSVAVARALRGEAGVEADGAVSRARLFQFVRTQVRGMSEAKHSPNLLPQGGADQPVFVAVAPPAPAPTNAPSDPAALPVRVAVLGLGAAEAKGVVGRLSGAAFTETRGDADLIWDAGTRQVITGLGDLAASDLDAAGLQGAVDKARFLRVARDLGRNGGIELTTLPNDREHRRGALVGFEAARRPYPYLVVFNVSGDGSAQFQYPLPRDPPSIPVDKPFRLEFSVQPPFGADHLVAISSPNPLDGLRRELAAFDGKRDLAGLTKALKRELDGKPYALGVQGLYTVP